MRRFSVRPPLTFKGRAFKGLRGVSGVGAPPAPAADRPPDRRLPTGRRPGLDLGYWANTAWTKEFYQAASFVLAGCAAVSVLAPPGPWDRWKSSQPGTLGAATINTHALIMETVTVVVLVNLGLRWFAFHAESHPPVPVLVLSLVAAAGVALRGLYGGTMVFDYEFNVETAGDHPAWHVSEQEVFPAQQP